MREKLERKEMWAMNLREDWVTWASRACSGKSARKPDWQRGMTAIQVKTRQAKCFHIRDWVT